MQNLVTLACTLVWVGLSVSGCVSDGPQCTDADEPFIAPVDAGALEPFPDGGTPPRRVRLDRERCQTLCSSDGRKIDWCYYINYIDYTTDTVKDVSLICLPLCGQ